MGCDPRPGRCVHRVFVYGTLMPGGANARVAERAGAWACRPASVGGFRLFHLDPEGYPAVVPGRGIVHGWLLCVRGSLAPLDELEGVGEEPPLYLRVRCVPRGEEPAWIYRYARTERLARAGAVWVPDGRWRHRG